MTHDEAWTYAAKVVSKAIRNNTDEDKNNLEYDWMETFVYVISVNTSRHSELDPHIELNKYEDWSIQPITSLKFIFLNK